MYILAAIIGGIIGIVIGNGINIAIYMWRTKEKPKTNQNTFNNWNGAMRWATEEEITNLVEEDGDPLDKSGMNQNMFLSEQLQVSLNQKKTRRNNNILVFGENRPFYSFGDSICQSPQENPGLLSIVEANALSGNSALVFLDGDNFHSMLSGALQRRGYTVQLIDTDKPATTPEKLLDWLLEEPLSAVFITDPRIPPMSPFDRAQKPKKYLTAGEWIERILSEIDLRDENGTWETAKNHNIRFFVDFRGDNPSTVPHLDRMLCTIPTRCNWHIQSGGVSIFLLANTISDLNRKRVYDDEQLIIGSCDTMIYMGGGKDEIGAYQGKTKGKDEETAKLISMRCGKREMSKFEHWALHMSRKLAAKCGGKVSYEAPDLISTQKCIDLKEDECIVLLHGKFPILDKICKRP